jgi:hypothetical protein
VLDVLKTEEAAVFGLVTGLGGDGDVLFRVGVEGGVLGCWLGWRGGLVIRRERNWEYAEAGGEECYGSQRQTGWIRGSWPC